MSSTGDEIVDTTVSLGLSDGGETPPTSKDTLDEIAFITKVANKLSISCTHAELLLTEYANAHGIDMTKLATDWLTVNNMVQEVHRIAAIKEPTDGD